MSKPTHIGAAVITASARLLQQPDLAHDQAMIAIATAIDGADPHAMWDRLDEAAIPLFRVARGDLRAQARALAEAITDGLGLSAAPGGPLLLNQAFAERSADPLLLAGVGHELARHAGLRSAVACSRSGYWTALLTDDAFLPVGFGEPNPLSAAELRACCAHRVAHEILVAITATAAPVQAQ